jgi:hypothetical protein
MFQSALKCSQIGTFVSHCATLTIGRGLSVQKAILHAAAPKNDAALRELRILNRFMGRTS